MKILTFDTSTDTMYITISEDGNVELFKTIKSTKNQYNSAFLIPAIIELLKEKNLTMDNIDAVGVNLGPGSFTGIRVSATVARVIGQNLNIPIVGIPSLQVYSLLNNTQKNCLCLLDAKKGKAYLGIYTTEGDEIQAPEAVDYDKALEIAKSEDYFIISDKIMQEKLKNSGLESLNLNEIEHNFGIELAKLTCRKLKNEDRDKFGWYNLKPLYIQPPPVTMPKAK